ncbi:alpha-ketoglutarate-dependent dioxygenase AlkB [Aureivirga marina]|uniref:alpha-ketoglutarate-dependent dioxygenase AlkB n=1 Tax=Aureivirga marina TaxID=1182451 RepID=UPI0018CA44F1|nr:alpha-ketoglutarate-dependent dioxygenase AlkB [Aureivirga marina]
MSKSNFHKINLPLKENLFQELSSSILFENTGKGRFGKHLVKKDSKGIPIVRTTTNFLEANYFFDENHLKIIENIKTKMSEIDSDSLEFNNALIEIYEKRYRKMSYHSDQCLDVHPNSYIALFSCYKNPETLDADFTRKLKIKNKETTEESEIILSHNSVVLFSISTNSKFVHKIILDNSHRKKPLESENHWLGITFRVSKNFLQFKNDIPILPNGEILKFASENQRKAFFLLKGKENNSENFIYSEINYSLSFADTIIPKNTHE